MLWNGRHVPGAMMFRVEDPELARELGDYVLVLKDSYRLIQGSVPIYRGLANDKHNEILRDVSLEAALLKTSKLSPVSEADLPNDVRELFDRYYFGPYLYFEGLERTVTNLDVLAAWS